MTASYAIDTSLLLVSATFSPSDDWDQEVAEAEDLRDWLNNDPSDFCQSIRLQARDTAMDVLIVYDTVMKLHALPADAKVLH